jgi:hypothetical protein
MTWTYKYSMEFVLLLQPASLLGLEQQKLWAKLLTVASTTARIQARYVTANITYYVNNTKQWRKYMTNCVSVFCTHLQISVDCSEPCVSQLCSANSVSLNTCHITEEEIFTVLWICWWNKKLLENWCSQAFQQISSRFFTGWQRCLFTWQLQPFLYYQACTSVSSSYHVQFAHNLLCNSLPPSPFVSFLFFKDLAQSANCPQLSLSVQQ